MPEKQREPELRLKTVWRKFKETMKKAKESAAPAQPVPFEVEDVEFNKKWHLVSANRKSSYGDIYQRPGESAETANVGAWYDTACYWRRECEKARASSPAVARCELCEVDQPLDQSGNFHEMGGAVKQRCTRKPAVAGRTQGTTTNNCKLMPMNSCDD